jgi:hypothetical protein
MTARATIVMCASRVFGPGSRRFPRWIGMLLIAVPATLLAGCGTSSSAPQSTARSAAAAPAPHISRGVRAQEAAIHEQVLAALHHDTDARTPYGRVPVVIRSRQKAPANQTLSATMAHPADAIQGISVKLHLSGGTALATAIGPDVPTRIQGSADLHTPAIWDLTFDDVHGTIPLSRTMFSITDEQGMLLSPRVTVAGGGPLPKTVPSRRPFTLQLKTVVSVGDGKLRYTPTGGAWLAEWDFDVETD